MVSAIYIIVAGLGAAFLLGLLGKERRNVAYVVSLLALAFMSWVAASWVFALTLMDAQPIDVFTAGAVPPFSINLRIALPEAVLVLLVSLTGLLSAIYLKDTLLRLGRRAMAVLLIAIMALSGIILTRDIFNLFVFFELAVISTGGLILLSKDPRALGAGIKYLVVSQVISLLLLVGIAFIYHASGNLNIDGMADTANVWLKSGSLAFFLIFIALIAELKPFPANGWALDIYESAHPAFSAIFSAATGAATLFAVDKILLIGGDEWLPLATSIGIVTFVASNILALSQNNDRRLLGYSSVAQIGLILAVIGQRDILGDSYLFIAGGLLLAHGIAKAGLFWLSGLIHERQLTSWTSLRNNPLLVFSFMTFIAMLVGLPPFPGFYAKWELAHILAGEGRLYVLGFILFGALIEAGYLFRWFGTIIKGDETVQPHDAPMRKQAIVLLSALGGWGLGYLWGDLSGYGNLLQALPLLFALGFFVLDWLPARLKNTIAIIGLVGYFYLNYQSYNPMQMIFGVIFLVGGAIILLASFYNKGKRIGFYPAAMLMYAGLAMLIVAKDSFGFFASWEVLTIGSYFLILRGKNSKPHALSYIIFSLGGAFALLAGFAIAADGAASGAMPFLIQSLAQVPEALAPWVFILLSIGFMTKTAAIGLHIWLPGAHAEAETDVSPMVSGILLKAGLFGLMSLLLTMGKTQLWGVELTHVLMWIGALSALLGNLMAIFQEDAKRLLAYSSIGQMGYALFGLAMMNHLGWLMALMFVINHYVYKSMLFLSIGGVAKRTGTKQMYKMGGLITIMPISFIVVLIGIIAISGVPPLSGFGGRWIFYNAILTADIRLPMILIFLSGPIAFLYLFRLIHTIFLGQLKDEHRHIKEAPFWIILPQVIYVLFLLVFATFPGLVLRRVDTYLNQFFPEGGLSWDGLQIVSDFGYWSPVAIMIIVGVIFVIVLAWLMALNHKAQKVKQFNIVFAAERPHRPETTHVAWNFFAPYQKALGFLAQPFVTRFWGGTTDLLHSAADFTRRFYSGNGQTYAAQYLAFVVVIYLFTLGGLS